MNILSRISIVLMVVLLISCVCVCPVAAQMVALPAAAQGVAQAAGGIAHLAVGVAGGIAAGVGVVLGVSTLTQNGAKTEYYIIKDVKNANKNNPIESYDKAIKTLSDCRGGDSEKIFILGASEADCIKLCDDASKEIEGSGHKLDGYHASGKGQYKHCHPVDKNGHQCNPHCIYGEPSA